MKQLHLFENSPEQLTLFTDEQLSQPVKPAPKVIAFPVAKAKKVKSAKPRLEDMIDTMTNDEILAMLRDNPNAVRYGGRGVN